jgi:hypothetical protein
MSEFENDHRSDQSDIAFRRRALRTNGSIYARRYGPALLALLSSPGIRTRCGAQIARLGSEQALQDADASRLRELAAEIARFGRIQAPECGAACEWHAARLRELVNQHAVLRRIESPAR